MPNFFEKNNIPVPYGWQCGTADCNGFAAFAIAEDGSMLYQRKRCLAHLPVDTNSVALRPASAGAVAQTENSFIGQKSMDAYAEALSYAVNAISSSAEDSIQAQRKLAAFKDEVVQTVVDWDAGCREGKEEFLQSLGLEWPTTYVTITVTFNYNGDAGDIDSSSIEYAVERELASEASDMYCEVDY